MGSPHVLLRSDGKTCYGTVRLPRAYFANALPLALVGTFLVGVATGSSLLFVTTATQESVPDELPGRVMGIVFLANTGAKPAGLLPIAPLYAVFGVREMFVAGGIVVAAAALASMLAVESATRTSRAVAPA